MFTNILPSGFTVLNTLLTETIKSSPPVIFCKHNISVNHPTHISRFLLFSLYFKSDGDDNQGDKVTYLRKV